MVMIDHPPCYNQMKKSYKIKINFYGQPKEQQTPYIFLSHKNMQHTQKIANPCIHHIGTEIMHEKSALIPIVGSEKESMLSLEKR